jgi:hypothetical protein
MTTARKRIHHRVTWKPMTDPDEIIRSSIGGYPILPAGEPWPVCTENGCGQKLAIFVQIELDQRLLRIALVNRMGGRIATSCFSGCRPMFLLAALAATLVPSLLCGRIEVIPP